MGRRPGVVVGTLLVFALLVPQAAGASGTSTLSVSSVSTPVIRDNQISLSWTNPKSSRLAGVLVRRATGSTPPSRTSGTKVGFVAKPGHRIAATGLRAGTKYSFSLWPRLTDGSYGARVTRTVRTAPARVTSLTPTVTDHKVTLTWTNPATSTFTATMVRRAAGTTAPGSPTAGTRVADVAKPGHSVADSAVAPGSTYTYALFTHDSRPRYSRAVIVTVTTPADVTAPAAVTALSATPGATEVALSWTNPTTTDFAGVVVRRQAGSTAPATIADGTLVTTLTKPTHVFTDTGLSSSAQYSYSVFARDAVPNYAVPAQVTTTTTDPPDETPPTAPGDFFAAPASSSQVHLTWTSPPESDVAQYVLRRADGDVPPATPTDGVNVTVQMPSAPGMAESLDDSGLSPDATYSYSLFVVDGSGNVSTPATTTVMTLPAPVDALIANPVSETEVELAWTYPAGPTLTQLVIRHVEGVDPPTSPADGVNVVAPTPKAAGSPESFVVSGLASGTTYTFAVFSQDAYGNTSLPATVTVTTL
jgi:chitodextrinase